MRALLLAAVLLGCAPPGPHYEKWCTRRSVMFLPHTTYVDGHAYTHLRQQWYCADHDSVWVDSLGQPTTALDSIKWQRYIDSTQ